MPALRPSLPAGRLVIAALTMIALSQGHGGTPRRRVHAAMAVADVAPRVTHLAERLSTAVAMAVVVARVAPVAGAVQVARAVLARAVRALGSPRRNRPLVRLSVSRRYPRPGGATGGVGARERVDIRGTDGDD